MTRLQLLAAVCLVLSIRTFVIGQSNGRPSESRGCGTEAIQNASALQQAVQDLKANDILCVAAKDITLKKTLIIEAENVTIRGQGQGKTTLRCHEVKGPALTVKGNNSRIESVTVTGCDDESAVVVDIADGNETSRISFSKVDFHENGENSTTLNGGALRILKYAGQDFKPAIVSIDHCSFKSNRAILGGAIFGSSSHLSILNTTFENNHASRAGGAIYLEHGGSRLIIKSSSFSNNQVTREFPTGLRYQSEKSICQEDIKRCGGGAIFADSIDHLTLSMSNLTSNTACSTGGAVSMVSYRSDSTEKLVKRMPFANIRNSEFYNNTATFLGTDKQQASQDADGYYSSGGGIFAWSDKDNQRSIVIENSAFTKNQGIHGGGIFLEEHSRRAHFINSCSFTDNYGEGNGGGLLLHSTNMEVKGSSFVKNRAFSGGGICLIHDASITIKPDNISKTSCVFHENIAMRGGGIYGLESTSVSVDGANFTNNVGLRYGGGAHIQSGRSFSRFLGVVFRNNSAVLGGGMSISGSKNFTISNSGSNMTTFSNNRAIVGGGLYYTGGHLPSARFLVENAQFFNNTVYDADSAFVNKTFSMFIQTPEYYEIIAPALKYFPEKLIPTNILKHLTKIPSGYGGGVCLELEDATAFRIREIIFQDLIITGNRALVGGGGVLQMNKGVWNQANRLSCFPIVHEAMLCQKLIFQNVSITNNMAAYAGGLFSPRPNTILTTCNAREEGRSSTLLKVMKNRLSNSAKNWDVEKDLLCTDIHSNSNQDGNLKGGEDIGSVAATLVFNQTVHLKRVASGENLTLECHPETDTVCPKNITVSVQDAFNQTIHSGISDASLRLLVSSKNIIGETRYRATNGAANINGTRAWGIEVSSNITIQAMQFPSITVTINFSTRPCDVGEYTSGSRCQVCPSGQYAFNPSVASCLPCEEYANCTGGAVLVPVKGYWHSTPFSPLFHRCVSEKACSSRSRDETLKAYHSNHERLKKDLEDKLGPYLKEKNGHWRNISKPEFDDYDQCSEGYEGILCGSCERGYGHSANGECVNCPDNQTLSLIFLVLQFVWLTILISANAAVILRSSITRIQLTYYRQMSRSTRVLRAIPRVNNHVSEEAAAATIQQYELIQGLLATTDETRLRVMDRKLTASVQLSETIKILVNYLQIVSMAINVPVPWEKVLHGFLNVQASSSNPSMDGVFMNSECFAETVGFKHPAIVVLWMKILMPVVVMWLVLAIFTCAFRFLYSFLRTTSHEGINRKVTESWTVGATVIVVSSIFMTFVQTTHGFLSAVNCVHVDEKVDKGNSHPYGKYSIEVTHKVWVEDTAYYCFHGRHLLTGYAGVGGLVLSIVVIALTLFWIPLNRTNTGDIKFIARYSFLYQGYKEHWYTAPWEAMILLRKAALVSVVVFAYRLGPGLQASLAIGILLIALALQNAFVPFKVAPDHLSVPFYFRKCFGRYAYSRTVTSFLHVSNVLTMNAFEACSLFCSLAVFFTALIANDDMASSVSKSLLAVFAFFINLMFVLFLLFRFYAGIHAYLDLELKYYDPEYAVAFEESPGIICLAKKAIHFVWLLCRDYVKELLNLVSSIPRIDINQGVLLRLRDRFFTQSGDSEWESSAPLL